MISNETFLFGLDKQGQSSFVEFPSLFSEMWRVAWARAVRDTSLQLQTRGVLYRPKMNEWSKGNIFPA